MNFLSAITNHTAKVDLGAFVPPWPLFQTVPDHLLVKPVDPWPGDKESGSWLCEEGTFTLGAEQLSLRGPCWEPVGVDLAWLEHMHGFSWLRDLRARGGEDARYSARLYIQDWIQHYRRPHKFAWRPDVMGERVSLWISLYEFFNNSFDEDFNDAFFASLMAQGKQLAKVLPGGFYGTGLLKGLKGLLYAGLAFQGREIWVDQALYLFTREMDKQILGDGGHISRSPAQLLEALKITLEVKMALDAGAYPVPEKIQHAIDRMGPALKFFRYNDKGLALFHGAQEGDRDLIDCILAQTGMRGKGLQSLPSSGYEKISQGRTSILFDCGRSPSSPHDRRMHAAPLSFEMTYGKDRVLVNCGSHPTARKWFEALRHTSAHNALSMNDLDACEIKESGFFGRKVKRAEAIREDTKDAHLLESSHDGYYTQNGVTHRRRLFLHDAGNDLRGEDTLSCKIPPARAHKIDIRFHIHPRVMISLIQDGREALIRLPNGIGWRFHHNGQMLSLEDSIYLGEGAQPRKSKQLVVTDVMSDNFLQLKWGFQREGV